jgi:hypothetical protein
MLKFKFGIQVDMTSVSFIDFNQIGDISDITFLSSTQIIAITTTGATVTLTGIFDLSSETTILNSVFTGIILEDFDDSLIFSFTGIENITIGNIVLTPDSAILTILNQVSAGVTIVGSEFSDVLVGATGNDFLKECRR